MNQARVIYTGWSGWEVRALSYSQANEMSECGKKFELKRISGWEEKLTGASLKFGIACENAVVAYLAGGVDPVKKFDSEWETWKNQELSYSSKDGDWEHLSGVGRGLMKEFPRQHKDRFAVIDGGKCFFQKKLRYSEINQGGLWNGVDIEYIADCIQPNLPILLDFKTASASYPEPQGDDLNFIGWDHQLSIGAWMSGIRNVGFITMVKTKTPKIQFITGRVTDEAIENVQLWIKRQLDRILNKDFTREIGFKFPNQHCTWCEVAEVCIGSPEKALAAGILTKKVSKSNDIESQINALDALEEV